jgi:hypothetical protein
MTSFGDEEDPRDPRDPGAARSRHVHTSQSERRRCEPSAETSAGRCSPSFPTRQRVNLTEMLGLRRSPAAAAVSSGRGLDAGEALWVAGGPWGGGDIWPLGQCALAATARWYVELACLVEPSERKERAVVAHTWKVLVVAHRTALSEGLEAALRTRLERGPASFTLVVPLGSGPDAQRRAQALADQLCKAGLDVQAHAGDPDPVRAVLDVWSPAKFDELIVSTLPASTSRWMRSGLIQRLERQTGALVRHVEARQPTRAAAFTTRH